MKKRKKQNERITLMIIPQSAASPHTITLSRKAVQGIVTVLVMVILTTTLICYKYYNSQAEIRRVNQLKAQNESKQYTIEVLNNEIYQIEQQQQEINEKQTQIKKMMGIKDDKDTNQKTSRGGRGDSDYKTSKQTNQDALREVQNLKSVLAAQDYELKQLLGKVNSKKEYYRSVPNQWPVQGEITSPYGWRGSPFGGNRQSFHDGIDIGKDVGTTIVAAADGQVIFAGWQAVYGKTLIIEHNHGFMTKYGHNNALLVKEGDTVKKGEPIALLGNTGRSTGPHLHFTIIKGGHTEDPLLYLP